jgi:hypothetical protein
MLRKASTLTAARRRAARTSRHTVPGDTTVPAARPGRVLATAEMATRDTRSSTVKVEHRARRLFGVGSQPPPFGMIVFVNHGGA